MDSPQWPARKPLPDLLPDVPTMTPDLLPPGIGEWVADLAKEPALPLEMLAWPAMAAVAGLVGASAVLKVNRKGNFAIVPTLWTAIVAPPGAAKSYCLHAVSEPLRKFEIEAAKEDFELNLQRETRRNILQAKADKLERKGDESKAVEINALKREVAALEAQGKTRFLSTDSTAEAFGVMLWHNPAGLLYVRDELAPWITYLEPEEKSMARGLFVTAWGGDKPYSFDRVGRDPFWIPRVCTSVIGAIQPAPLDAVFARLQQDLRKDDGLVQRFCWIFPGDLPPLEDVDFEADLEAKRKADRLFRALLALRKAHTETPLVLTFSPAAEALWRPWKLATGNRGRSAKFASQFPRFASFVKKLPETVGGLSALFAILRALEAGTQPGTVEEADLSLAMAWGEFAEAHGRKVYRFETNPAVAAAHRLAQKIENGEVEDGMTLREAYRPKWSGLNREAVREALAILADCKWINTEAKAAGATGGRPSIVIRLHPDLQ